MPLEDRWLLPEGVEDVLPPCAGRIEVVRRRILDRLHSWGYELVIPPLIEYLDSLLTGMGHDLDLQTFKLTDPLSGRLVGVRADMTPQVARIDAHRMQCDTPTRLCYLGPVLQTYPSGLGSSRNPFQIGAELFGHRGIDSDVEVLCLMIETLGLAGIAPIYVDLGHMAVFRGLTRAIPLSPEQEEALFQLLQRKAHTEIRSQLQVWGIDPEPSARISALAELDGDEAILRTARAVLGGAPASVFAALDELEQIARMVRLRSSAVRLHFDLAELRGYHYHNGVMFAAYTPGQGQALAKGGRYDDIGAVFGRPRAATGFSCDLKLLVDCEMGSTDEVQPVISAVWSDDPSLHTVVAKLRSEGKRIAWDLPQPGTGQSRAGARLLWRGGHWVIAED